MRRGFIVRLTLLAAALSAACGGFVPLLRAATIDGSLTYVYATGTQPDAGNNWPACTATLTIKVQ
ncbi:MAG TPA: hypothetical protein VFC10_07370 [Terriglobia bacterium]|jgi:hypothetical protein|nr:hypothetical protein [Terracidiphilus sp.]HZT69553.1 hypothetical protein [Terriglobia bacterium]